MRQILSRQFTPSEGFIKDMEAAARLVQVVKNDYIVRQGVVCDDFVFNRKGLFRVCHEHDGIEDTFLFGTSGDIFTSMHSFYAGKPSVFSLLAVEDSEVWLVSYSQIRNLLSQHEDAVRWLMSELLEQMYALETRYVAFNSKSAEERLENFLKIRFEMLRKPSVKDIFSIVPLKYIASYLRITPETLSRLRRKMLYKDRNASKNLD
jgi:CRP-like cAMP-binding protein